LEYGRIIPDAGNDSAPGVTSWPVYQILNQAQIRAKRTAGSIAAGLLTIQQEAILTMIQSGKSVRNCYLLNFLKNLEVAISRSYLAFLPLK
jgi:hypothetical protein